jgi:hypothetical protein
MEATTLVFDLANVQIELRTIDAISGAEIRQGL